MGKRSNSGKNASGKIASGKNASGKNASGKNASLKGWQITNTVTKTHISIIIVNHAANLKTWRSHCQI